MKPLFPLRITNHTHSNRPINMYPPKSFIHPLMLLGGMLALSLFATSCGQAEAEQVSGQPQNQPVSVEVETVSIQETAIPIAVIGQITPTTSVQLSFRTGGFIQDILVDEGDVVRQGQVLATLNRTETSTMVQRADIAYKSSLRDLARVQNLFADSAATRQQLDDLQALADVRKADLDAVQFALDRSVITAPADGIVMSKMAEANSQITQGEPVLILGTGGKVVVAGVSDRDIHRLRVGDRASFTSTAFPGEIIEGRISRIPAQAVARTGVYEVEVSLWASTEMLRSGLIVRGSILPSATQPLVAIPIGALVEADGDEVWVYTTSTPAVNASRIKVRPVHIADDVFYVRPEELGAADRVITRGAAYLRPDSKILVTGEVQR